MVEPIDPAVALPFAAILFGIWLYLSIRDARREMHQKNESMRAALEEAGIALPESEREARERRQAEAEERLRNAGRAMRTVAQASRPEDAP